MAKKKSTKRTSRKSTKKASKKTSRKKTTKSASETEKILIENFTSLQKVMANLSNKFDDLTKQISKLLELFEISAKSLAKKGEKNFENEKKQNEELKNKLKEIQDQNKVIAKGLSLLHEKDSDYEEQPQQIEQRMPQRSRNIQEISRNQRPQQNLPQNQKQYSMSNPSQQQPQQNPQEAPSPPKNTDSGQNQQPEEDPFGDVDFVNEEEPSSGETKKLPKL